MGKYWRVSTFAVLFYILTCNFSVSVFAQTTGTQQSGTPDNNQPRSGRQGQQQQQQGIGGGQPNAQPVRPGQASRQSGSQTSNQTDVTPSTQTRPAQVPQSPPTQTAPPRGTGTIGEPAGTTTPRAPIGQGGIQLPNTQIPATGAARFLKQAPSTLSLADAIRIALDNNLSTLIAETRVEEAQALARQQRAALLPNIYSTAFQQNRTLNLRAQGISSGSDNSQATGGATSNGAGGSGLSIPSFVGPFNTFDARIFAAQSIFNLAAIRDYRSSKSNIRLAESGTELTREQVAVFVTLFYLNVLRADRDIEAAQADLTLAQDLLKLANEQRAVGIATGIDVVRAGTQASQDRLRLLEAETVAAQSKLDLQRIVGLPQDSPLNLIEPLRFIEDPLPAPETLVSAAIAARPEIRIAEETLSQRERVRKARVADQYPSLEAYGDYGDSGATPFRYNRITRTYGVRLNVPIFDGGLTRARIDQAAVQSKQAELELGNTRGQVEEEVRLALISLSAAAEQVRASDEQFNLATRELDLARMRFAAGVADNTEIVSAQAALANARSLQIQALAQHIAARLNLAAATGRAQDFRF